MVSPENSHLMIFMTALLTLVCGLATQVIAANLCMSVNETHDSPTSELLISYLPTIYSFNY